MKLLRATIISVFVFILQTGYADIPAQKHLIWNRTPVNVILPVNKEKMLTFPSQVQFGYNQTALPSSILQALNNNGTLYLTAHQPFRSQHVAIRLIPSGRIILLNLSAQKNADNTSIAIEIQHTSDNSHSATQPIHKTVNPIELMRFAEQQLYAPLRLLTQPPNIFVTPMHTTKTVPLVLDGSVIAMPLRSWQSGPYYVTAVQLHNISQSPIVLQAIHLCGDWHMSAFFPHDILEPSGQLENETTAFLLSMEPFEEAMTVCSGREI